MQRQDTRRGKNHEAEDSERRAVDLHAAADGLRVLWFNALLPTLGKLFADYGTSLPIATTVSIRCAANPIFNIILALLAVTLVVKEFLLGTNLKIGVNLGVLLATVAMQYLAFLAIAAPLMGIYMATH